MKQYKFGDKGDDELRDHDLLVKIITDVSENIHERRDLQIVRDPGWGEG